MMTAQNENDLAALPLKSIIARLPGSARAELWIEAYCQRWPGKRLPGLNEICEGADVNESTASRARKKAKIADVQAN